jgi:hypothetical protein
VVDGQCDPVCDQRIEYGSVAVVPSVTITPIKAVGKDETAVIRVANPSNTAITLTLSPISPATGVAYFTSTNNSTRQITMTTDVEVKGITESSTFQSMRLEAKYTNSQNQVVSLGTMDFTVIKATLSLRYASSDSVSTDNIAKSNYESVVGTDNLGGPRLTLHPLWVHGIEIKAEILPSNFNEILTLQRVFNGRLHHNQTLLKNYLGCSDTSTNPFLDNDPQSNGSFGKVYDLDAPGINLQDTFSSGYILRTRTNFTQWLSVFQLHGLNPQEVRVSANIYWYQRLSVIRNTGPGTSIINDVSNDNILGTGTTNLTWNLDGFAFPPADPCP